MAKRPHAEEANKRPADEGPPVTPELMKVYYDKAFPCATMFRWLSYKDDNGNEFFSRREFSLTLPGNIYVRYKSFDDYESFRRAIIEMQPEKIDIGAVYSFPPKMHKFNLGRDFVPTGRELVFDIDMDDYDDIRTSGNGPVMTKNCWKSFMATAMKAIDRILREDFGFKHFFFVFSGRRGLHCWVCDEGARALQNDVRSAVCQYCTFVEGNNQSSQKVRIWEAAYNKERHPAVTRAVELCTEALTREGGILDMQGFLEPSHAKLRKVLDLIPAEGRKDFEDKLNASPSSWNSRKVWNELCATLRRHDKTKLIDELAIEFAWPRLDMNVTKQMNHLLKAPFCVHPGTGKVCVPVALEDADTFDPDAVPTVRSIAKALDAGLPSPLEAHVRAFKRFIHNHHVEIGTARRDATDAALEW